jgi:ABC-type multidrug transport system fused ATPase/permease subunit
MLHSQVLAGSLNPGMKMVPLQVSIVWKTLWIAGVSHSTIELFVVCLNSACVVLLLPDVVNLSSSLAPLLAGVYASLAFAYAFFIYIRTLGFFLLGLWTARILHEGILTSILRAPMSFFDTTPVGRILNRFSMDQSYIDENLSMSWNMFLNMLFSVSARPPAGDLSFGPCFCILVSRPAG